MKRKKKIKTAKVKIETNPKSNKINLQWYEQQKIKQK